VLSLVTYLKTCSINLAKKTGKIYNMIMKQLRYLLANFIDAFNQADKENKIRMIESCPFPRIKKNRDKAYSAALVEELCVRNRLKIPAWVEDKKLFLKEPFFVGDLETLKAFLLVESPVSFRRRNIFVSENVLTRV
jgi:hypothetical protein